MTAHTLALNYSLSAGSVINDSLWLRLQQENIAADVATVGDAAAVLDALYDIEPCVDPGDGEESTLTSVSDPLSALTKEDLTAAAAAIDYSLCDQEPDGSVNVTVRIIRSDLSWPYQLRISGGRVVASVPGEVAAPVEVRELYRQNMVVESASSIVLDYPVVSGFSAQWIGAVLGENGRVDAPTINRTGTTLHWAGNVTGIIAVSFNTVYEVATIRVEGIDGEQGECLVRCFYHGLVEELEPILPESAEMDRSLCPKRIWQGDGREDQVTCYQEVTIKTLCECSREEVSSRIENQVEPCPEWAPTNCPNNAKECMHLLGSETAYEYVACAGDNEYPGAPGRVYALSTPEFYEATCCEKPKVTLPSCPEKKISYRGGEPIDLGAAYYQSIYGSLTRIVPVSPPGGICGEHIIRQVIGGNNCCEGVPPIVWDTENSATTIADNSYGWCAVSGGRPPFLVSVRGSGFFANDKRTVREVVIPGWTFHIFTGDACGTAIVTVSDGCSTVQHAVFSTNGSWQHDYAEEAAFNANPVYLGAADYIDQRDGFGGHYAFKQVGVYNYRQFLGISSSTGLIFSPSMCPLPPGEVGYQTDQCLAPNGPGVISFDAAAVLGMEIAFEEPCSYVADGFLVIHPPGYCQYEVGAKLYYDVTIWEWRC